MLYVSKSTKMTNLYKVPLHGLRSPWFDGAWKEQIYISFKYLSIMKKINVSELIEAKYYLISMLVYLKFLRLTKIKKQQHKTPFNHPNVSFISGMNA